MSRRARYIMMVLLAALGLANQARAVTTGSVTITGNEQSTSGIWDMGTVTVSANGYSETVSYGQFSTPDSIASAVAAKFTSDCNSPANARSAPNGIVNFRTKNGATLAQLSITESSSTSFAGISNLGADITSTSTLATIGATAIPLGQSTQVSVQVSCGSSCGAQSLMFKIDGGGWETVSPDSNGQATASTSTGLAPGLHNVIVSYLGNDSFLPSSSNPVSFTVLSGSGTPATTSLYSYSITQSDGVTSGYASNGNIQAYTDKINGIWSNIGYDNLNRLTGATQAIGGVSQSFCWDYDSFGNRLSQVTSTGGFSTSAAGTCINRIQGSLLANVSASYGNNNQITSTNSSGTAITPTYDAAGDITNDGANQYLYDAEGRVCAVASMVMPGMTTMTEYLYDAEGRRVAKGNIATWSCDVSSNGYTETAGYILGPNGEQVTEMDGSGNWVHTNVYAAGQLIATYANDGLHFHLSDWLGSRRVQTDYAGNPESNYQNQPFGEMAPDNHTASLGATEQHFTGKERDTESGLDYFGARYYGSSMGRFMSPDPGWFRAASLDDPQSWNLYAYARNNPLGNIDPDGYDCVYLNNSGTDVDRDKNGNVTGIDTHSNSGECGKNGGYWVDGTFDHGTVFSNSNDVALTGHTTGSSGSQTPTDAYYTNAIGQNSDIIAAMGYTGLKGTVDLVKLYQNRPHLASIGPQNPGDVWTGCAVGGVPSLALDLSSIGIVPDAVGALQSGSLNPLFNSGDTANNVGNAVDVAGKAAEALVEAPMLR